MTASRFIASSRPLFCLVLLALSLALRAQQIDATEIIRRSVEANQRGWKQLPEYDYFVREHEGRKTKTYLSQMLLGSRYYGLVAVDDKPLSAEEAGAERERFEKELKKREHETPQERKQRVAKYQKEMDRDRFFMEQLADAFDFILSGKDAIAGHEVYVLTARPRRGYHPPNTQAKALTGMRGTLWIDSNDFHWVKVRAEVFRSVSIEGFLARIEPGTRFEFDQRPIKEGLWLPSRFLTVTRAKVLFFFSRNDRQEETYFGYKKAEPRANP
jgi:hypothetical protein